LKERLGLAVDFLITRSSSFLFLTVHQARVVAVSTDPAPDSALAPSSLVDRPASYHHPLVRCPLH
jgi:hypothetical protein